MEAPQKFRSALNGFHRDDVVHYLEFLNTRHQTQLAQLNTEIDTLRAQVDALENAVPVPDDTLVQKCEGLQTALSEKDAQLETLQQQLAEAAGEQARLNAALEEAQARLSQLEADLRDARQTKAPEPLDTYRHAETVERESRTRAELVYYQANGVLTQATGKVSSAAEEITALADQAAEALTRLQMAVSGSKHTLQDAAAMMKSIRPNA